MADNDDRETLVVRRTVEEERSLHLIKMPCINASGGVNLIDLWSLVMIISGIIYMGKCPHQPLLPIWLIIAGVVWILHMIVRMRYIIGTNQRRSRTLISSDSEDSDFDYEDVYPPSTMTTVSLRLLFLFLVVWLILGTVLLIHGSSKISYDKESPEYCDKDFYKSMIGQICFGYVLVLLVAVATAINCCCPLHLITTVTREERTRIPPRNPESEPADV